MTRRASLITLFLCAATTLMAASDKLAAAGERRTRSRGADIVVSSPTPDVLPQKSKPTTASATPFFVATSKESKVNTKYQEGIDVSRYQGTIDWNMVANQGRISYAYVKATEGASLVDPYFYTNIAEARRAGISVGSYHFYRAHISVDLQVANMTAAVRKEDQDLVPMIDVETTNGVSKEKFLADLRVFVDKITQYYGVRPLIYTYQNFYNRYLVGEFPGYHWMIAKYHDEAPYLDDEIDYIMWQYTQSGYVPGVRGGVDRSCIMGTHSLTTLQMH